MLVTSFSLPRHMRADPIPRRLIL